jgi:hypothetical protein
VSEEQLSVDVVRWLLLLVVARCRLFVVVVVVVAPGRL